MPIALAGPITSQQHVGKVRAADEKDQRRRNHEERHDRAAGRKENGSRAYEHYPVGTAFLQRSDERIDLCLRLIDRHAWLQADDSLIGKSTRDHLRNVWVLG